MPNKNVGEHQFLWRIENFSACTKETNFYLSSPIIRATDLDETFWTILIAPRGETDDSFVSVRLDRSSEDHGPTNILLELQFCLIDLYGKDRLKHCASFSFVKKGTFILDKFARRSDIFEDKDILLPNDVLTLQCRARKFDRDRFIATRSVVRTKITVERSKFLWTVRGLTGKASAIKKSIHIENRFVTKGMELSCECSDTIDERETPGAERVLRLAIKPNRVPKDRFFVTAKIQIVDSRQNPLDKIEAENFFEALSKDTWHLPSFDISDRMESLMKEDRLDLNCSFSISDGSQVNQTEGSLVPLIDKFYLEDKTLLQDIGFVYESGINADVTVKVSNGIKRFRAHKIILSARSSAFRSILNDFETAKKRYFYLTGIDANNPAKPNDVNVCNENIHVCVKNGMDFVEVYHLRNEILDQVLKCIYTDVLNPDGLVNAMHLYKAGAKFGFRLLREKSEYYLKTQICMESLCDILVFAHFNTVAGLRNECLNYITENREIFLASDRLTYHLGDHEDLLEETLKILKFGK